VQAAGPCGHFLAARDLIEGDYSQPGALRVRICCDLVFTRFARFMFGKIYAALSVAALAGSISHGGRAKARSRKLRKTRMRGLRLRLFW
jgi:hypothetical protein